MNQQLQAFATVPAAAPSVRVGPTALQPSRLRKAAMSFTPEDVISTYSRKEAIDDGVLIDVSATFPDLVKPLFKVPVVFGQHLWALVQEAVSSPRHHNDINGVVHDVLWLAFCTAKRAPAVDQHTFKCILTGTSGGSDKHEHELVVHIGPGDAGEPVITIMAAMDL